MEAAGTLQADLMMNAQCPQGIVYMIGVRSAVTRAINALAGPSHHRPGNIPTHDILHTSLLPLMAAPGHDHRRHNGRRSHRHGIRRRQRGQR